ncbi:MAG: hypothetical protein HY298_12670 [Verrucomicrobia bacterium]|nr:hypothetical protein [Verrucomicrobiota bacterium]
MLAAVDTNFLLALAADDEDALDAADTLRRRAPRFQVVATPTVLEELRFFKVQLRNPRLQSAATKALASFRADWNFQSAALSPAQHGVVERVADHLRIAGVLPHEERHDSFILVEAALLGAKLLVTKDSVVRGADYSRLVFELREFDLHPPVIATPKEIVRKFFH